MPAPTDRPSAEALRHAEVRARGTLTRYTCFGQGPCLLLLCESADPGLPLLTAELGSRMRVVVPETARLAAGASSDLARWLVPFLEGLGAPPVPVLAVGPLAEPMLSWTMRERNRVTRLALLPCAAPSGWAPYPWAADHLAQVDIPLLAVGPATAPDLPDTNRRGLDHLLYFLSVGARCA